MDGRIKRLVRKNDDIYDKNEELAGKMDIVVNHRVVENRRADSHRLVIIKNNDDPDEYEDDDIIYDYCV